MTIAKLIESCRYETGVTEIIIKVAGEVVRYYEYGPEATILVGRRIIWGDDTETIYAERVRPGEVFNLEKPGGVPLTVGNTELPERLGRLQVSRWENIPQETGAQRMRIVVEVERWEE